MTPASARRNQLVTVAMVFAVFTGFAFVLPFLPLFVRELGVEEPERAALWAGVLIGVAPLFAGLLAPVWGRLADRHGVMVPLLIGSALWKEIGWGTIIYLAALTGINTELFEAVKIDGGPYLKPPRPGYFSTIRFSPLTSSPSRPVRSAA